MKLPLVRSIRSSNKGEHQRGGLWVISCVCVGFFLTIGNSIDLYRCFSLGWDFQDPEFAHTYRLDGSLSLPPLLKSQEN